MATPKLLFYTHGLADGGAERLWSCLASAFKQRGYEVIFAQDFEAEDNRTNLDLSIPLHTLGRNHFKATRELARLIKREKPDVALSAVGGSNLKLLAALRLARSPARSIISYHGFEEWKTGFLSFLTYLGLPFWSVMTDRTVAVSEGLGRQLTLRWGADSRRKRCILNPVFFPASARVPSAAELASREEIILAAGRLVPIKDFPTLLRAFARLDRPKARLVILGKGPAREEIEQLVARYGLGDRVSLPGYSMEPWHAYETAKCFVLSSRSEPFGNVIVEALAHGLPIVATECAGPKEILEMGKHGRIVSIGDDLALSHAISETLDSPGDPAPRRARADEFSFDVRVPAYEALIKEVLAANKISKGRVSQELARHAGAPEPKL